MNPAPPVTTTRNGGVQRYGEPVVRQVLGTGLFELEVLVERATGEYYAIDLNPRGFGQMTLDMAAGRDGDGARLRVALSAAHDTGQVETLVAALAEVTTSGAGRGDHGQPA